MAYASQKWTEDLVADTLVKAKDEGIFATKQVYSTTETEIGTWMGKTLYRKLYSWGKGVNNTSASKTFAQIGIPDGSKVVNCDGLLDWGTGRTHISTNNSNTTYTQIFQEGNGITIKTNANLSSINITIIVEYTK